MNRLKVAAAGAIALAACSPSNASRAEQFTLYRNSFLDSSARVHWATFDADESDRNYNRNNCEMAARLLNANLAASARAEGKEPDPAVGVSNFGTSSSSLIALPAIESAEKQPIWRFTSGRPEDWIWRDMARF